MAVEQEGIFQKILNIFKVPELRNRLFFTIMMLLIFRIGSHIPIPGVDVRTILSETQNAGGFLMDMIDLFAGGGLKRMTVFALGIMPYISSSIVIQLLTAVIPALERLSKEGEQGRKKISEYTRYGTILVAVVQSIMISFWMRNQAPEFLFYYFREPQNFWLFLVIATITISTGCLVLMWLGDMVTEKGIGNGISIIIFAGIVARLPWAVKELIEEIKIEGRPWPLAVITLAIFFGVVAFVVYMEQAQRRIPVQYARRIVGRRVYGQQATHIPLKLNPAGVIPIIFAGAVMMIFPAIGNGIARWANSAQSNFLYGVARALTNQNGPVFYTIQFLLIIFFCYFYTSMTFNPDNLAENLRKYGGFIPGIRPGKNTAEYIKKIINRILLPGSIFLGFIATLPAILYNIMRIPQEFAFLMGGTSVIIIIGVALDTMKQIESQLLMRHYDGFLKKGKLRGRR